MTHAIDLNADAGESFGTWKMGRDEELFHSITSVNLACGAHAGDPLTMNRSVELAVRHGLSIGAHPGYPDLAGFGRRFMTMEAGELFASIVYQLGALAAFAKVHGTGIRHVKAHGALYLRMMQDAETADTFVAAVKSVDPALPVVALAGSGGDVLRGAAENHGLRSIREAFPDRAYLANGFLAPRPQPGSLIVDPELVAQRAVDMVVNRTVATLDGGQCQVEADTLCIHGDHPAAPEIAAAVRRAMDDAGVHVRPPA